MRVDEVLGRREGEGKGGREGGREGGWDGGPSSEKGRKSEDIGELKKLPGRQ
jgi:hypothetical protein